MALHTLIIKLHTLSKYTDYQIDNMLVYAVYAKSKIKLFRRDIIYETFVMKYIAFPFCIFLDCSSLDAWASLAFGEGL